ncbi:hypothetical protein ACFLZI_02375 [Nitrospirota bacterium]
MKNCTHNNISFRALTRYIVLSALLALAMVLMSPALSPVEADIAVITNTVAGTEPTDPLFTTLDTPGGIALDTSGNLYIADTENHLIRKVTAGVINTVAGNGELGYSGDGGPATSAELNSPRDVSVDAAGNLYIADTFNNVIRIVNTSGIINTVAGTGGSIYSGEGIATQQTLNDPQGVLVDAAGNIYIAENFGSRIRIVNAAGFINTLAGDGSTGYSGDGGISTSAIVNSPIGLAMDSSGNLYISDFGNESIRMINSSGIINTVAGSNISDWGYSGDGGLANAAMLNSPMGIAFDALDHYYIADSANSAIRNVAAVTEDIDTFAGTGEFGYSGDGGLATSAMLNGPEGVAYDNGSSILYISDTYNHRIRTVADSGDISTFAGNGFEGSLGDGGLANAAILYEPNGVVYDSNGSMYIADLGGHQVRKVNTSTGIITTIAGTGEGGYSGDGGAATSALLNTPAGLALDEANEILYIADSRNHAIRAVNLLNGLITTIAGDGFPDLPVNPSLATSAKLWLPRGLTLDTSGNLYIADTFNNQVRVINKASGLIDLYAGNSIAIPDYTGDGGLATSATLNTPYDVWMDSTDSVLYIADTINSVIRFVTTSTNIINTVAGDKGTGNAGYSGDGGSPTSAFMNLPEAVAVTQGGEIVIADTENHAIRYIDPFTGIINTIAGNGTPGFADSQFYLPASVTTGGLSNTLYIADAGNKRVRSLKLSNRVPSAPELLSPADAAAGLINSSITFTWNNSTDLDGDTITYELHVCSDITFGTCTPDIIVALNTPEIRNIMYASSASMLFFMGVVILGGHMSVRRRLIAVLTFITLATFIIACGGGGGGSAITPPPVIPPVIPPVTPPPSQEVTGIVNGLNLSTTYYWKVVADDGTGNTATSEVWSFMTQ